MGFKLKSQKAVKQGGFKLMGSSPMKEDDVAAKIKALNESQDIDYSKTKDKGVADLTEGITKRTDYTGFSGDRYLQMRSGATPAATDTQSPSTIDWSKAPKNNTQARRDWYTKHNLQQDETTVVDNPSDSQSAETTSTTTTTSPSDVRQAVEKAKVTTKKRKLDGKTRVEKKSYTTKDGVSVTVKRKFDSAGNLKKVKKKVKKDGVITKAKNKLLGKSTKKTSTRTAGSLLTDQQKAKAKKLGMTFKAYLDKIRKK